MEGLDEGKLATGGLECVQVNFLHQKNTLLI